MEEAVWGASKGGRGGQYRLKVWCSLSVVVTSPRGLRCTPLLYLFGDGFPGSKMTLVSFSVDAAGGDKERRGGGRGCERGGLSAWPVRLISNASVSSTKGCPCSPYCSTKIRLSHRIDRRLTVVSTSTKRVCQKEEKRAVWAIGGHPQQEDAV
jgi:hypothetical protein